MGLAEPMYLYLQGLLGHLKSTRHPKESSYRSLLPPYMCSLFSQHILVLAFVVDTTITHPMTQEVSPLSLEWPPQATS